MGHFILVPNSLILLRYFLQESPPFMQNLSLEQQMQQQQQQLQYLIQNDASFQNEKTLKLEPKSSLLRINPKSILGKSNQQHQLKVDKSTNPQKQETISPSIPHFTYEPNNEPIYSNSSLFNSSKPQQRIILTRNQIAQDEWRNQNGSVLSLNYPSCPSPYVMYSLDPMDTTLRYPKEESFLRRERDLCLEQLSMNRSDATNIQLKNPELSLRDLSNQNQRGKKRNPRDQRDHQKDSSLRDLRDISKIDTKPRSHLTDGKHLALSSSNQSIYNQLQFPSASNFGSMKRKKKVGKGEKGISGEEKVEDSSSDSSGVVSQQMEFREEEYSENNVKIWSLQYIPQMFSVSKNTAKA